MRIAYYVPNVSFLEPGIGGDCTMVRNLMEGLVKRGHDVRVASRLDAGEFGDGNVSLGRLAREAISVRREMKTFSPDAWLIYSPSDDEPDLFGWWLRPQRYVIYGAHPPGELWGGDWRSALLAFAHRRSFARADKLIAWHPSGADRLRSMGIAENRMCLLLNAAESWDPLPGREEARRHLGLPQKAPIILCAARFSVSKRPGKPRKTEMMLDLIAAVRQLPPEVILLLVGDNGRGRERLETEAAAVESAGRIRVIVSLEHDDMRWYYAACDLYAYPHPKDTPWVSVLEAQHCGRPVITIRTRSAEMSVDDGRSGLLARDLDEFRALLAELLFDRARCESMGREARRYVARHHSLDVRLGQIEQLLRGDDQRVSS